MTKVRLHKRVKDLVKEHRYEYSTPEIQNNIAEYGVYVDGQLEFKRLLWVESFQEISIDHWPRDREDLIQHVPIFFQDDQLIVFDKPYGLAVQSGVGHMHNNLVSYIHTHFEGQRSLPDCGLAHRLDINTQGLILVAKNIEVYTELKRIFKERAIKKTYLARVFGKMPEYDLQYYQTRSLSNPTRQKGYLSQAEAEKKHNKVRFCHTIFEPLQYCQELEESLVRVIIKTGRTHQIRVSAEMLGHPLINDEVYSSASHKYLKYNEKELLAKSVDRRTYMKNIKRISKDHEYCLVSNSLEFSLSKHYCFEKFQAELE